MLAIIRGSFPCPNKNEWFEAALTERQEIHWLAHIIKRHAYRVNGNQVFSISSSSQNTESTKWSSIKPQICYDCIVVESSNPTVVGKYHPWVFWDIEAKMTGRVSPTWRIGLTRGIEASNRPCCTGR